MAIRDGESSSTPAQARRVRQPRPPAQRPGLFYRTVIPSGAVTASTSCSVIPQDDATRDGERGEARQLAVASASRIVVHGVDAGTDALHEMATLQMFTLLHDVRAMPSPRPLRDVLVVLAERNVVAFVAFDDKERRLRVAGHVELMSYSGSVRESRFLATHPRRNMCAVASLSSTVVVFPVLFLRRDVSVGKIVHIDIDGVILGMDFLDDDESASPDAVLLVLIQRASEQWIAVYTVGAQPGTSGGGLSVSLIGSMITGSERPVESAVARHAAKLGNELRTPSQVHGLSRIPRAPFLFVVFLEGRIVVADARPVILGALESRDSMPLQIRVRPEHHFRLFSSMFRSRVPSSEIVGTPGSGDVGAEDGLRDLGRSPNMFFEEIDDSSSTGRGGSLGMLSVPGRLNRPVGQRRGLASALSESGRTDPYLSYYYVPSSVSLDFGSGEGSPTAWTSAHHHFRNHPTRHHEDAMYIVTDSGALFVLHWSLLPRKGTYVIPGEERSRTEPRRNFSIEYAGHVGPSGSISALDNNLLYIANDGADGSLRRVEVPKTYGTPATDPRWAPQARINSDSLLAASSISSVGYGLEVRQEFLNLSPVADFIMIPPGGVQPLTNSKMARSLNRMQGRYRGSLTPASASPSCLPRKGARHSRGPSTPHSTRSDPESFFLDRLRRGEGPHSPASPESTSNSARTESPKSKYSHFSEPEIVLCCGIQKAGTVRIVKPGAPVTVFSSSSNTFQGCNDIWSIRLTSRAKMDTLIAMAFSQATRVLFSAPAHALHSDSVGSSGSGTISHLLDATAASEFVADARSLAVGRLEDGLIAQVHPSGVRTVLFAKKSELRLPLRTKNGILLTRLFKCFWDWSLPVGHVISTATIGAGYVFLGVARSGGRSPCLFVLKQTSTAYRSGGLSIVSKTELSAELSCITVTQGFDAYSGQDNAESTQTSPPIIMVGTYSPTIEIWTMGPALKCLSVYSLEPWCSASSTSILESRTECDDGEDFIEENGAHPNGENSEEASSTAGSSQSQRRPRGGQNSACTSRDHPHFMKTWSPEKVLGASVMTGVPESLCAFGSHGKQSLLAGLRNGTVLQFTLNDDVEGEMSPIHPQQGHMSLIARHKIGDIPVKLFHVFVSTGAAIIAQAERPWLASTEKEDLQWIPLAFPETRSWCSYAAPGADRCLATVAADDVFYICGLRRLSPVSISSILIGETPRRVVALHSPVDTLLVATCREPRPKYEEDEFNDRKLGGWDERKDDDYNILPFSELKVYHKYSKKCLGAAQLNPGELVHVLLRWCDLIVVGTSIGIRSSRGDCRDGRLLLYSVRSQGLNGTMPRAPGQSRAKRPERAVVELCSEVIMQGAVLAGAVHSNQDMLVVSCNNTVYVFGIVKNSFFEVTRVSTRMLVLSIAIHGSVICVADRKDSVGFFRLNYDLGKLVRDRTDHQKRIVAGTVMVDSRTAMVTDKFGGILSLAYNSNEVLPPDEHPDNEEPSVMELIPDSLVSKVYNLDEGVVPAYIFSYVDSMNDGASDSLVMHDENHSEGGTDSQAYFSDTLAESNDGTVAEGLLSVDTAGNSTMNDDYSEDIEVEEVEGASIIETAGTTDGHNEADLYDVDALNGVAVGHLNNNGGMEVEADDDFAAAVDVIGSGTNDLALPTTDGPGTPPAGAFHTLLIAQARRDIKEPIQRTLDCDHIFNMRDTALKIRKGIFKKVEQIDTSRSRQRPKGSFWDDRDSGVFAATLGGALISAVPICASTVTLLSEIGYAMTSHVGVAKSMMLNNYSRFRSAYGTRSKGVVDGDLLQLFLFLKPVEKVEVCSIVGLNEKDSAPQIDALIQELCYRVG